jgi:hypothetical protein
MRLIHLRRIYPPGTGLRSLGKALSMEQFETRTYLKNKIRVQGKERNGEKAESR